MVPTQSHIPTGRPLWSLLEDAFVDEGAEHLTVHGRWGAIQLADTSPIVREALHRMSLGPVALENISALHDNFVRWKTGSGPCLVWRRLKNTLDQLGGCVVPSLGMDDGAGPILSVVAVTGDAVFTLPHIEDDEAVSRVYVKALRRGGFDVLSTTNAQEARRLFQQETIDLVLSDINMPGMSGVELLKHLRAEDLDVPVILMTGAPDISSASEAVALGAMRYLTKPIDISELERIAHKAVQLHRFARIRRQALAQLGTPAALGFIEQAIEDGDRAVRLVAVRAAGTRGYQGALKRVEGVVLGRGVKEMDLTEKMAFFEAYGAIAGAAGLKALSGILLPRGLLKLKEPPETRACAAMALGKIRSPEARELLQKVADDKDLVVRNAANRALRESAQ